MSTAVYISDTSVSTGSAPGNALLETEALNDIHCVLLCLQAALCVIAFYIPPGSCNLYDYIPKRDLRKEAHSRVYKTAKLTSAEAVVGSVYAHDDTTKTWADAIRACHDDGGGELAMPKTGDALWLVSRIMKSSVNYWIGLTDAQVNGQYRYLDGEQMGANGFFIPEEPLAPHPDEHGAMMFLRDGVGMMADASKTSKRCYVCQIL